MGTDATLGPDGQPSRFDGVSWVSQNGQFWWNGAAWQPVKRPGFQPPFALAGMILVFIAGVFFLFTKVLPSQPTAAVVMGVTNTKIDSPTQIELDYARKDDCSNLTFEFVFYDKAGKALSDRYISESRYNVTGGKTHHYTFYTIQNLPATAARFDAIPTCHA
jgi:hypothetical protein